jgi:hypothetical protein
MLLLIKSTLMENFNNRFEQIQRQNQRQAAITQKGNEQYPKLLEKTLFPSDKLPPSWLNNAKMALECSSPYLMGITPAQYISLRNLMNTNTINMFQVAALNNNFEQVSPRDMGVSLDEYCYFLDQYAHISGVWNEMATEIRKELDKRLNAEQDAIEKATGGKSLAPVKAEA